MAMARRVKKREGTTAYGCCSTCSITRRLVSGASSSSADMAAASSSLGKISAREHRKARAIFAIQSIVNLLSPARVKAEKGKCEGRKSYAEKRPEVVAEARRLRRASPTTGERRSLQKISRELRLRATSTSAAVRSTPRACAPCSNGSEVLALSRIWRLGP